MNGKQKILIADDSEINRALLMEILGDGYEYLEAENGVRAVELLREHTDIALVLLDIMMPQMDGFDVLKVMRCYSWLDEIPVIMISAAKDTANIERAYDLGVADYMRRPFERVMVLRQVQNVLMLYAKQKRLTRLVTDQVYEKEHNSVLMISILSHVVEFRNSESGQHVLHIRTLTDLLLHQLVQKTDRYQLDESDISLISTASALHDIGKIGIDGVESNLGTAIRTGVVLVMAWLIVLAKGKQHTLKDIPKNELGFICLSGLATGGSWLCYYKALQDGLASVVVPIDKLSILVSIGFSALVFKERLSKKAAVGLVLIVGGTLMMLI